MKLYLVTMNNGEAYYDYSEFTEIVIAKDENNALLQIHQHEFFNQHSGEKQEILIKELSSIYGYNINLEKNHELVGKKVKYSVIDGLDVINRTAEIIDVFYHELLNKEAYTLISPYGHKFTLSVDEVYSIE